MLRVVAGLFVFVSVLAADPLFEAIQRADAGAIRQALKSGASADSRDGDGTPALMLASLFGGVDCMHVLLDGGADVNAAANNGATALHWAVPDPEKVRLLVARGANVNARSTDLGRTPLLIAASYPGTVELVRFLLSKGADLKAKDRSGDHALLYAARTADVDVVRVLVEAGIGVNEPSDGGGPALTAAVGRPYLPTIDYLIAKGARAGPAALARSADWLDAARIKKLLTLGADVNAITSTFRRTPLIHVASSEGSNAATLRLLLENGADPNIADADGETALDWAMHRLDEAKIRVLKEYGASEGTTPRDKTFRMPEGIADSRTSVARSVALLLPTGPIAFQKRGCISCHQQSMPLQAAVAAREKGLPVDEATEQKIFKQLVAVYKPAAVEAMQGRQVGGGDLTIGYIAMALAAEKHPPDKVTAALSHTTAARQMPDGVWIEGTSRPPMEYSSISRTAMAVRTLTLYPIPARAQETEERLRRARTWLLTARARSAEERAMRLMALAWTKASQADIAAAVRDLTAEQFQNGGWAQLAHLPVDAYATGISLYAMLQSGVPVTNSSYARGVGWLLKTQYADGSWFVKTRSFPVQPQHEGGYPFGYNQWISAAAACWSSLAIAATLPDAKPVQAFRVTP